MDSLDVKYKHNPRDHNLSAPLEIVPLLIQLFHPTSVIDYGCGVGNFLYVFMQSGVNDILGLDGWWVDGRDLYIPERYFLPINLEEKINLNRNFDLVLCLEVAEHISDDSAITLINNLTSLGKIIIFSAAIKNQGGQNHINEQPFEYWIEKFKEKEYVFYDIFRKRFWNNPKVNWWYKQNMFLVMHQSICIEKYVPDYNYNCEILEYIHPELFELQVNEVQKLKSKIKSIREGKLSANFYLQLIRNKVFRRFFSNNKTH